MWKAYIKGNYFFLTQGNELFRRSNSLVEVRKTTVSGTEYEFNDRYDTFKTLDFSEIVKQDGTPYTPEEWETFINEQTGVIPPITLTKEEGSIFLSNGVYTSASPFVVNQGFGIKAEPDFQFLGDGAKPKVHPLYDRATDKLVAINEYDTIDVSIRFKYKSNIQGAAVNFSIDIGGTQKEFITRELTLTASANTIGEDSVNFKFFTGTTFIHNGGDIKIRSITGNTDFFDFNYLVELVNSAV